MYKHYLEAVFNAERKYLHTQLATHKFCLHLVFLEYRSHEWGTSQWSNSNSRTCWTSGAFGYWGLLYTTGSRWSTLRKKIESLSITESKEEKGDREGVSGCMGEWVDERVSEWVSEWVSECSGWMSEWVIEWVGGWAIEWVGEWMN